MYLVQYNGIKKDNEWILDDTMHISFHGLSARALCGAGRDSGFYSHEPASQMDAIAQSDCQDCIRRFIKILRWTDNLKPQFGE